MGRKINDRKVFVLASTDGKSFFTGYCGIEVAKEGKYKTLVIKLPANNTIAIRLDDIKEIIGD